MRPSPAPGCSFATLLLPHRMGTPPLPAGCTFRQASRHLHLQSSALLLPLSLLATRVSLLLFLKPTLLPPDHAPASRLAAMFVSTSTLVFCLPHSLGSLSLYNTSPSPGVGLGPLNTFTLSPLLANKNPCPPSRSTHIPCLLTSLTSFSNTKTGLLPTISALKPLKLLQDVYSQRAASAWQGAQPQKLTVSMLLPGTSSAAEWRDLLQSRRQFWPTLTTRHASLVPVSAEALQRERRQMQAKHLWYNVDIRWSDLKDKLEVLAPTGLTRDDIWRHLFLTKQRKNPYEEGCYTGEDVEDVKQKWEDKKHYFEQYKKDVPRPPCIDLERAILGFNIDNSAAFQAIDDSKALHARRWQTKEGTYRIKRRALPDVRDAPLQDDNAAASCSDGKPRWRCWDGDYAMGYQHHP